MEKEIQEMHDKIAKNDKDPRRNNILEVLEEVFGVNAVTEWLKSQKR